MRELGTAEIRSDYLRIYSERKCNTCGSIVEVDDDGGLATCLCLGNGDLTR